MFLGDFLLNAGIWISLLFAAVGLGAAFYLIKLILAAPAGDGRMKQVAAAIEEGAKAYLNRQVVSIGIIAVIIFILTAIFKGWPTAIGFLIGAVCSLAAGFIGMRIAVLANVRTAQAASSSRHQAMCMAFNGGAVTGLLVVGLALLSVGLFYEVVLLVSNNQQKAISSLIGLALGSSLISVFARLGGGIYTKAADVGADLVGKIESHLDEDDPRNPATIADNVGDNVGDCAGMAADVFETYAVSLIGAILIGSLTLTTVPAAIIYPFLLGGVSVLGAVLGIYVANVRKESPGRVLLEAVAVNGILSAVLYLPITYLLFPKAIELGSTHYTWFGIYLASLVGIVLTAAIVLITNYYTSTSFSPVRKIALASETGHATNIIAGLATGQRATALPVVCIGAAILLSYYAAGFYGIAIAVMSMLSLAGIIISLDAFGPITDNAGGVAVMSDLPHSVRVVTDELDAVGNTMKAVTKGYAIASAGLAALVLFRSYVEELQQHLADPNNPLHLSGQALIDATQFVLSDPRVVIGLFIGGALPFLFSAFSMDAVGNAAGAVVREVRRQLAAKPGILKGEDQPEYGTCVDIVTKAALGQMIVPALLPVVVVMLVASIHALGHLALGGMLMGTIVTGLFLAISMTGSGGAWDNAKKYIEEGHHGGKGSPAHAASVTGDTVGDPYKDTAGPAINPMIKVVNIVAILIIPLFF